MGSVMASDLEDSMEINSLIQEPITVNIFGQGAVVLNGEASVTSADVQTSNGIIHIIDKVLIPPTESRIPLVKVKYVMTWTPTRWILENRRNLR